MTEPTFRQTLTQLVIPVYLPSFIMSMCQGIVLLMIPLFALDLGAGVGMAAIVFSLRGLGNVVADVPAGAAASRLGDKPTMLIGVGVMCLAALAASFSSNALGLSLAAFLLGVGMATWMIGRLTFISDAVPALHRGKSIATMAGIQRFGNFLGPTVSGVLAFYFGFEVVFLIVAALSLLAAVLVMLFVDGSKVEPEEDDPHQIPLLNILPSVLSEHRHAFATAGVAMLMLTMLRASRQLLIPLWGESISLNTAEIGYIMGAAAFIDMCMFPIAGYVLDRFGRKPAAMLCLAFLTIGLLMVPFSNDALVLTAAALVVGMGNGLGSGINMTLGTDLAPPATRGEFLGVWRLAGDAGSFAGPVVIGSLAGAVALTSAFYFVTVAGVVGMVLIAFFVKETMPGRS